MLAIYQDGDQQFTSICIENKICFHSCDQNSTNDCCYMKKTRGNLWYNIKAFVLLASMWYISGYKPSKLAVKRNLRHFGFKAIFFWSHIHLKGKTLDQILDIFYVNEVSLGEQNLCLYSKASRDTIYVSQNKSCISKSLILRFITI